MGIIRISTRLARSWYKIPDMLRNAPICNYEATVPDQPVILGTIQAQGDATGVQPPSCSPADTLR